MRCSSRLTILISAAVCLSACTGRNGQRPEVKVETLFTSLPTSYTGIDFENRLVETQELNVFTYRNFYNGGGVGIGDLNGDGLPDIFLTANLQQNRLFLNEGDFRFRDVTTEAGVAGRRSWTTGISIADVNGDGLLDLYVAYAGLGAASDRANELYINRGTGDDGTPRFEEVARRMGLADEGYSIHAAFFDYDGDGDLDAYVMNNSPRAVSSFGLRNVRNVRHESGGDRLYRNEGDRFVDVSAEAGIFGSEIAFGLGVSVGDVNRDGWPDLYVSNDFFERDYLYVNNQDGTFSERLEGAMPSISLSSMGADMADLNNDGFPEIYVTDMLADDEYRLKTTMSHESWREYQEKVRNGYHHQFTRNTLQLNNGNGTFSEIGRLAGVSSTDWSWTALLADFDADGLKDIFVSNGVYRNVIDQDYIDFLAEESVARSIARGEKVDLLRLVERSPSDPVPNYLFAGRGDLTYSNVAEEWGLGHPTFSSGAAYGDLDSDGDLDLVVNNVNGQLLVYRNEADSLRTGRFLQIELAGEGKNRFGIGAAVTVRAQNSTFYVEQMPTRGYQSSVDPVLTIGLGEAESVDTILVRWPDGRTEVRTGVATNQRLRIAQGEAQSSATEMGAPLEQSSTLLTDVTSTVGLSHRHRENTFVDFDREALLLKMLSTEGPRLAVGDVNGDGLSDVFIGGAKEQAGELLIQRRGGGFAAADHTPFGQDAISEDVGAAFFDADGDGDLDLYVASGGSEYSSMAPALLDRLYLNDGRGRFARGEGTLPAAYQSGSCVEPADFDGDGDVDLFICGRLIPWRYGLNVPSVLLENDGAGRFADVTSRAAPQLTDIGMVTDAVWADYDGDARPDLILVGEWMPVTVLRNEGAGKLTRVTATGLERSHGWWNVITAADFDADGMVDFALGNLGLNTQIKADSAEPATMHVHDFDTDGYVEQIVSYYRRGTSYPMTLKADLVRALPFLRGRFPTHRDFAGRSIADIFSEEELQGADMKHTYTLSSAILLNRGREGFLLESLPIEAQFAPVYAMLADDLNGDGAVDLLLAGNLYGTRPEIGRLDAGYGLYLSGRGDGSFDAVPAHRSGFMVPGQARDLASIHDERHGRLILVARNDAAVQIFKP